MDKELTATTSHSTSPGALSNTQVSLVNFRVQGGADSHPSVSDTGSNLGLKEKSFNNPNANQFPAIRQNKNK